MPGARSFGIMLLENAHEPSREGVERFGVEQEIAHAQKRYEDEQSINPVPDGWPQFGHRAEYDRIGLARKPKLLEHIPIQPHRGLLEILEPMGNEHLVCSTRHSRRVRPPHQGPCPVAHNLSDCPPIGPWLGGKPIGPLKLRRRSIPGKNKGNFFQIAAPQ